MSVYSIVISLSLGFSFSFYCMYPLMPGCQDPHHLYTFCDEFHQSMTLPRGSTKQAMKEEAKQSRERWMTSAGWQTCDKITWEQWNCQHKTLDESRIEELAIVSY